MPLQKKVMTCEVTGESDLTCDRMNCPWPPGTLHGGLGVACPDSQLITQHNVRVGTDTWLDDGMYWMNT